jgi:hypothetical protein
MLELNAIENLRGELEEDLLIATIDNPVVVSRLTLRTALTRYISGELENDELTAWANLIECNELVQYEPHFEKLIATILFYIAGPEINGQLTPESSREYLKQLSS